MKIYVDILFFINTFFDFILLLSTSLLLKRRVKIIRIVLGSIVGGLSIIFLFFKISSFTLFIFKILIAIIMCIISFNYKNYKYTIKNVLYLYLISIVLGGFLYFLNIEFSYKNNGLIFYHKGISINIILILIISPILLFLYVKEMNKVKDVYSKIYDVDIYFRNKNIVLKGFLDTGNNLIDPYKNRPVIIINYSIIKDYIKNYKRIMVPYNTVDNTGIMECVKPTKIIINNNTYNDILIGLSYKNINISEVDCILNNTLDL